MKRSTIVLVFMFVIILFSQMSLYGLKPIKLATVNWAPYYGENLQNQGFVTDLAKEAFKRAGYSMTVEFVPWKRALELAKKGDYDGLLGAYYNEKRKEYFQYSIPISSANVVIIRKKSLMLPNKLYKLKDLAKYKFGTINGYSYGKEFDNATFIKKDVSPNLETNLIKLYKGRYDLAVVSREVMLNLIQTKHPEYKGQFVELAPKLVENNLYIAISKKIKNSTKITNDFNAAFKSMQKDGTVNKILKKYGM